MKLNYRVPALAGALALVSAPVIAQVAVPLPPVAVPLPPMKLTSICALQQVGGTPPDITIPAGVVAEINGNTTCGLLTIHGKLKCAAGVSAEVKTDGIMISGANAALECGTAANRFTGNLTLTLRNNRSFPSHPMAGQRAIVVMQGGTLDLHGQTAKAGYVRLNQDAPANPMGTVTSLVTSGVSGWQAGDRFILTTTSTYYDQTEFLTLGDNCPGNICRTTGGLAFFHYGTAAKVYPGAGENGRDLSVDMRAYLANVERNIQVRAADDIHWAKPTRKGGHLMIMASATAHIDAVALERMGQRNILGRYPVHFHHAGLIGGQYVRNSAIHNSASRCIALHNTHRAEVSNNLCYDISGHALFLENGNEIGNTIANNLIADVIPPRANENLLQSDLDVQLGRWRGPAGVWVANPNNTIRDNVVVNAGTGYWHAYVHKLQCYDDPQDKAGTLNATHGKYCDHVERTVTSPGSWNVEPNKARTFLLKDNVAVATRIGHTWDGAPDGIGLDKGNPFDRDLVVTGYAPGAMQTFDGLHAYKQGKTAIYYRGLPNTAHIKNSVVAEAPTGWFGTGDQEFFDSVFVGISENYQGLLASDKDFYYHADPNIASVDRGGLNIPFKGWGLYDGSNHFKNITFDYPSAPLAPMFLNGKEITPVPISIFGRAHFSNHIMEALDFVNNPYRRINLDASTFTINWKDVAISESNYDADGSLFGLAGYIRPNIPFNDLPGDCVVESNSAPGSSVLRCTEKTVSLRLNMAALTPESDYQSFTVTRLDTGASAGPVAGDLFSKFQMYNEVVPEIGYLISALDFKELPALNRIWIQTHEIGDWTPTIIIDGATAVDFAPDCSSPADYELHNWPGLGALPVYKATSPGEIRAFNDTNYSGAYYQHVPSGTLVLKMRSTVARPGAPHLPGQHKGEHKFDLRCPPPSP